MTWYHRQRFTQREWQIPSIVTEFTAAAMSFTAISKFEASSGQKVPREAPHIWINGEIFSEANAKISVFDRGFLYGDSVFETIRTYQKRGFALDEHLRRLYESAARVWIEPKVEISALKSEVEQALALFPLPEAYLRLMFTRGSAGLGLAPNEAMSCQVVMILAPLNLPPSTDYERGIRAISLKQQRPQDGTSAAGAKIGNYLPAVLAYRETQKQNAKEALFVDAQGEVAEGATSNLFWVKDGRLFTPPLAAGILDGITRRYVLKSAQKLQLRVVEKRAPLSELIAADELFISSSIREVMPVTTLDEQPIASGTVGPLTEQIRRQFRKFVQPESE